ncbi:MAG: hypothetical protein BGN96_15840 [Bacteroidales bacterium 45-6]|nr:MAG: hypothetical protein BGN96_15840 [Bacteroidales bacterium 45-6]
MKTYLYILGICSIIFCSSCESEIDSQFPKNKLEQSKLTENDIAKLRNGAYSEMEDVVFAVHFDFDIRGENFTGGPGFSLLDPISMTPDYGTPTQSLWATLYMRLRKINFLIETIDASTSTSATLATTKGEAYYFRALIYYNLVTRWGGVPILKNRTEDIIQRATEQEVWDFIISDLQVAENNIGAYSSNWYTSLPAVYALTAKVYLAQKNNAKVIEYCNKIKALNKFSLATTTAEYAAMFAPGSTSKELIFSLLNNNTSNKHILYQRVNDVDATWDYSPATDLFSGLYANYSVSTASLSGDKRKAAVFSSDAKRIIKFPNGVSGQQATSATSANRDFVPLNVIRYADVILMLAEAQGPGTDAATTLEAYFTSRYTTPPSKASVAALDATQFQTLILTERRREFYGEGQWWYDVKRTNRTDFFTTLAGRTYLLYYPVPLREIDLAGYDQNPGYN